MNRFTSPNGQPFFSQLLQERAAKINSLINNLKIDEVRDDKAFGRTKTRIKDAVLLRPGVIGDPKFVDHRYEERPLTMQQQLIGGISREHYVHKISVPISGSREVFHHMPTQGFSYSSSDRGLLVPYGNTIDIEVDLPQLNPKQAIAQANSLLAMTKQFVDYNNATLQVWNPNVEQIIEQKLSSKREELNRIFGA